MTTKRLNEHVKRNAPRFPSDFVFQVTAEEESALRSHIATLERGRGEHRKYRPYAFTEHGAIMAAKLTTHDEAIAAMLAAIRKLMNPVPPKRRGIGFSADIDGA